MYKFSPNCKPAVIARLCHLIFTFGNVTKTFICKQKSKSSRAFPTIVPSMCYFLKPKEEFKASEHIHTAFILLRHISETDH